MRNLGSLFRPQRERQSKIARRFLLAAALLLPLTALPFARAQQPQAGQKLRLAKIEFAGLDRVSQAEALEKSGLKVGQSVDVDEVEAAAQRLVDSGLFKNIGYNIRGKTDAATLTFKAEEMRWSMPVAFDNFVWFTDEELREAVRRKVPAFDGTAPESGGVTEQIARALEDLLRERKIEGTVEYTLSADLAGRNAEHLFTVKGAGLSVCRVSFPGARAVPEEALVRRSGGLFGSDYSRQFVAGFVESNLLPLYHERGHLRAGFLPPKVKPDSTEECEKGVSLTIPVEEGPIYVWEKAEWSGNQALTPQEMDAALGMRNREVANGLKIEKGLEAARRAYGRKGYLAARFKAAPEFDDTARRVTYRIAVAEGPQYRMGTLTLNGFSEKDANNLRGRWRLLPNEVYDEGYPDEFLKSSVREFLRDAARDGRSPDPEKIKVTTKPDRERLVVDVTIDYDKDSKSG